MRKTQVMITFTTYKLFVSLNTFPCKLMGEKEKYRTFQDVLVLENNKLSDKHTLSNCFIFQLHCRSVLYTMYNSGISVV